jgi:hypothetical protein
MLFASIVVEAPSASPNNRILEEDVVDVPRLTSWAD